MGARKEELGERSYFWAEMKNREKKREKERE